MVICNIVYDYCGGTLSFDNLISMMIKLSLVFNACKRDLTTQFGLLNNPPLSNNDTVTWAVPKCGFPFVWERCFCPSSIPSCDLNRRWHKVLSPHLILMWWPMIGFRVVFLTTILHRKKKFHLRLYFVCHLSVDLLMDTFTDSLCGLHGVLIWFFYVYIYIYSIQVWYNAVLVLLAGYMKYATVAISAFSIW